MEAVILCDPNNFSAHQEHFHPMQEVAGRPFLRYVLDFIIARGITHVILLTGRCHADIFSFFGEFYRGVRISYCSEDFFSIRDAISKVIPLCRGKTFFILDALAYSEVSPEDLITFGQFEKFPNVVAVKEQHGTSSADQKVTVGFSLIHVENYYAIPEEFFLAGTPVFNDDKAIMPYGFEFFNCRQGSDREKAEQYFLRKKRKHKAVFLDRDGTINIDVDYLYKKEELRFIKGMPEFIRKWNSWDYYVIVVTNQSGIARGLYTEEDMHALHEYMNERLLADQAHIDAFYFCPHHPDYSGKCLCRKPEPGLLLQAMRDFDLKPEDCILFGDSQRDIEAAHRCGIFAVLTKKNQ